MSMKWINATERKPQPHIRVLVYIQRPCTEKGALRYMDFAAWCGEETGWVSDGLNPVEDVTHWAVVPVPEVRV